VDVRPADVVSFGAHYGHDTYGSFQRSRYANPPPDLTWTGPSRDWTLDNDDRINTTSVYMDLLRAIRNTDIRVGYDYSDSGNSFVHRGPRIASLSKPGHSTTRRTLVPGVQGRGAVNLMVFGSNTNAVIRHARCPVLIVPDPLVS
jgi:hypothetical protein